VSLQEQNDAIIRYAQRQNLTLVRSFEEQETAAKLGRPVFSEMLRLLKHGKAAGVVIHKIDRGARNLKDWADLAELIDIGVEVHFANESLDLNTRGGRLSADIQAVVAADFIRNLREETKKDSMVGSSRACTRSVLRLVIWIAAAVKQRCPTQRWPDSFARRLNSMPPAISHCPGWSKRCTLVASATVVVRRCH
jgi:hypothetical protein